MSTQKSREIDYHVKVIYKYFLNGKPKGGYDMMCVALYLLNTEERKIVIHGWDYKEPLGIWNWIKEKFKRWRNSTE